MRGDDITKFTVIIPEVGAMAARFLLFFSHPLTTLVLSISLAPSPTGRRTPQRRFLGFHYDATRSTPRLSEKGRKLCIQSANKVVRHCQN